MVRPTEGPGFAPAELPLRSTHAGVAPSASSPRAPTTILRLSGLPVAGTPSAAATRNPFAMLIAAVATFLCRRLLDVPCRGDVPEQAHASAASQTPLTRPLAKHSHGYLAHTGTRGAPKGRVGLGSSLEQGPSHLLGAKPVVAVTGKDNVLYRRAGGRLRAVELVRFGNWNTGEIQNTPGQGRQRRGWKEWQRGWEATGASQAQADGRSGLQRRAASTVRNSRGSGGG